MYQRIVSPSSSRALARSAGDCVAAWIADLRVAPRAPRELVRALRCVEVEVARHAATLPPPGQGTAAPGNPGRPSVHRCPVRYFLGRMSPVWRYRVWNAKASLNMCGEWRPALGFFIARFT